jgi:hypothetical protein
MGLLYKLKSVDVQVNVTDAQPRPEHVEGRMSPPSRASTSSARGLRLKHRSALQLSAICL